MEEGRGGNEMNEGTGGTGDILICMITGCTGDGGGNVEHEGYMKDRTLSCLKECCKISNRTMR